MRGSVFLESGFTLPGAKVVLSAKEKPSKKLQEQVSSPQGEFAFRVPPGPSYYIVTASMKGFDPLSKEVEVVGQEQINRTFTLIPASKK
ncbi:MAG: carboxypeptidase-like regulatory domain-containing protein [Bryobacteraceae bacterium]